MLEDKTILLTGGTGSLGNKFVEIVLNEYNPKAIRIFSRNESKQVEMDGKFNDKRLRFLIGDVQDKNRLKQAMTGVDIVVHAAALKHISICEYNPKEAVKTNVIGSMNVIDAALETGVKRVIGISSDKAVHPTTFYGATKMTAEKLFIQGNFYSGSQETKFSCVRFGNLIGSSGSVIPLFQKQKEMGVLTLTDKEMTRFWVSLGTAVKFIVKCIDLMQGGDIFVPKMHSIRLVDLAEAIAPGAEHKMIGLRVGEKLHEEIILKHEICEEFSDCYVIIPQYPSSVSMGGQKKYVLSGNEKPDFVYSSNTNDVWLSVDDLKNIL